MTTSGPTLPTSGFVEEEQPLAVEPLVTLEEEEGTAGRGRISVFKSLTLNIADHTQRDQIIDALCGGPKVKLPPVEKSDENEPTSSNIQEGSFPCPICPDISYDRAQKLYGHLRKHAGLGAGTFSCQICGSNFDSLSKKCAHEKIHQETKRSQICPKCHRGFDK